MQRNPQFVSGNDAVRVRCYVGDRAAQSVAIHFRIDGRNPRVAHEDDEQHDLGPVGDGLAWILQFDPATTRITVDMMNLQGEQPRAYIRSTALAFLRKSGYTLEECAVKAKSTESRIFHFRLPPFEEWDRHIVRAAVVLSTLAVAAKIIAMKLEGWW